MSLESYLFILCFLLIGARFAYFSNVYLFQKPSYVKDGVFLHIRGPDWLGDKSKLPPIVSSFFNLVSFALLQNTVLWGRIVPSSGITLHNLSQRAFLASTFKRVVISLTLIKLKTSFVARLWKAFVHSFCPTYFPVLQTWFCWAWVGLRKNIHFILFYKYVTNLKIVIYLKTSFATKPGKACVHSLFPDNCYKVCIFPYKCNPKNHPRIYWRWLSHILVPDSLTWGDKSRLQHSSFILLSSFASWFKNCVGSTKSAEHGTEG